MNILVDNHSTNFPKQKHQIKDQGDDEMYQTCWSSHSNRAADSAICYHTKLPIKIFLQRLVTYQGANPTYVMERCKNPTRAFWDILIEQSYIYNSQSYKM